MICISGVGGQKRGPLVRDCLDRMRGMYRRNVERGTMGAFLRMAAGALVLLTMMAWVACSNSTAEPEAPPNPPPGMFASLPTSEPPIVGDRPPSIELNMLEATPTPDPTPTATPDPTPTATPDPTPTPTPDPTPTAHARPCADTHARPYADTHARSYADTHARPYADTHARPYADTHARPYADSHARPYADSHARSYADSHARFHADARADTGGGGQDHRHGSGVAGGPERQGGWGDGDRPVLDSAWKRRKFTGHRLPD